MNQFKNKAGITKMFPTTTGKHVVLIRTHDLALVDYQLFKSKDLAGAQYQANANKLVELAKEQ